MARNPNAKNNLRPFPKGVSGNPNGRPRSLKNLIKDLSDEAQTEIYGVLYHALTLPNKATARAYLERMQSEPVTAKYGMVFELAIESLMGHNGWSTLNDMLDRLFGKPRMIPEDNGNGGGRTVIVISEIAVQTAEAKPRQPIGEHDTVIQVDNQEQADQLLNIGELGV